MSPLDQHANIEFSILLKKSSFEMLRMLKKAYQNNAMKKMVVCEWHKCFHEDHTNVEDDSQTGHPSSSTADENVECAFEKSYVQTD